VCVTQILHAAQPGEEPQELLSGHPVLQRELTRQISDPRPDLHAFLPDVHPEDPRPPAGRMQEAQERADRRRLARPIGSEKTENLALLHRKVHVPDAPTLAVLFGQALGLYRRTHRFSF
jgi:hypothetical protein